MDFSLPATGAVDGVVLSLMVPIACWILLSGLDDLFIDAICLFTWTSQKALHTRRDQQSEREQALAAPQKRIAILVPLWQEEAVIRQMVTANRQRILYQKFDFFLGAYPNDSATLREVQALEAQFANVHVAVCGNPGPTSKADCLNWLYQRMQRHEQEHSVRFEIVVTHDAEDLIHPEALHWLNYYCDVYDMVQVPVLPLPTPMTAWTHGVYCDEFAEFQTKDMPGRQILGGFIPSNGVGTGFTRWALERLAKEDGRIFEPSALTEDYENGLRLHFLRCPQLFMPVRIEDGEPVATREYFPQTVRAAVKQRTRWVSGIALQAWERHGWRGGIGTKYWMWRDRKGLVGNPLSMLTSLLFLYGVVTWIWARETHQPWGMHELTRRVPTLLLMGSTTLLQFVHLGVRAWCTSRVYGWGFACGVPVRAMLANYINCRATLGAVWRFVKSKVTKVPMVWLKTDHSYPVLASAAPVARRLGEILLAGHEVSAGQLEWALATKPPDMRLGEHLVRSGLVREDQVYQALSLQVNIPFFRLEPSRVKRGTARALPRHVVESSKVIPFRVTGGYLFLAAAELPGPRMEADLRRCTRLEWRFQLVTPANFEQLRKALL